jgi:TrmH family RNA methyltransferase
VEGPKLVAEALAAGLTPQAVLCSEEALGREAGLLARLAGVPGGVVTEDTLARLADTRSAPALLVLFTEPPSSPPPPRSGLWLVLDAVQDPGNVGTLVRSALAFGASGAVVGEGSARPLGAKALRASAGAAFRLPLFVCEDWRALLAAEDAVLVADPHEGVPAERAPVARRTWLVLGNEGSGVARAPKGAVRVRVATLGPVESLNVAAAGAILLYALARRVPRPALTI